MIAVGRPRLVESATTMSRVGSHNRPTLRRGAVGTEKPSSSSCTSASPAVPPKDAAPPPLPVKPASSAHTSSAPPVRPPKDLSSMGEAAELRSEPGPPSPSRRERPTLRPLAAVESTGFSSASQATSPRSTSATSSDYTQPPNWQAPTLPPRINLPRHSDPPPTLAHGEPTSPVSPHALSPTSPNPGRLSVEPDLDDINEETSDSSRPNSRSPSPGKVRKTFSMRIFGKKTSDPKQPLPSSSSSDKSSTEKVRGRHGGELSFRSGKIRNHVSDSVISGKSHTVGKSTYVSGGMPGERSNDGRLLHHLTTQSVAYLSQDRCLREEGLFRISGDMTRMTQMRQQFLSTGRVDFSNVADPHLVAGLLKLHFRELKFALIPQGNPTKDLLDAAKTRNVLLAKRCLSRLPFTHDQVLKELVGLFERIVQHGAENKMTACNIARSCGPSIFHTYGVQDAGTITQFLIEYNRSVLNIPR